MSNQKENKSKLIVDLNNIELNSEEEKEFLEAERWERQKLDEQYGYLLE